MSAATLQRRYRRKNADTLATAMEIKTFPEPMSGCHLWHGAVTGDGYPRIRWEGRVLLAHRVAYELHHGVSPTGRLVCHKCDNTYCVNPAHLFLGTIKDNNSDRSRKGRSARLYGQAHHGCVLSDVEVAAIRAEYVPRDPERSTVALARKYQVSQATIWNIAKGGKRLPAVVNEAA